MRKENLPDDKFVELRKEKMRPFLKEFHDWLLKKQLELIPNMNTAKAVNYAINERPKFIRFLDSALLTPDNNVAENAIRPFVIGRKNWLFSNTPSGATASAYFYSLIETAKINGLEPFAYLNYLFEKLPSIKNDADLKRLLPYNLTLDMLKI